MEARVLGGDLGVGEAFPGDGVGDLLCLLVDHAVAAQAGLDLELLGLLAGVGGADPLLVGGLGDGATRRKCEDPPADDADDAEQHDHPDQTPGRHPPQLGEHEPAHESPSPRSSVSAKNASSRLVSTGRSSLG